MDSGVTLVESAEELPEIDGPWPLPEGWTWAKIESVLALMEDGRIIHHGWSPQCEAFPSKNVDVWGVLKTTAVQPGAFLANENKVLPSHLAARANLEVHAGDILLTCAGPRSRCGVACLVRGTRPRLIFSGKMYRFRSAPNVMEAGFLEAFLQTFHAWRAIDAMKTGGSDSGLNLTHDRFRQLLVPVAPLPEQRRIVARVDALFAEIAEGEAALAAARKGLGAFRRALLKAAVTGELTKDWRVANPVTETGRDLLARIAKDRAGTIQVKNRARPSADDLPLDATKLPVLPSGWVWAIVRDVGAVQLGRQRAPQHHTGEHMRPYLRVANVFEDRMDFTDVKEMNFTPDEFKTYQLKPGDILLNEGQTPDLLGRSAMWRGEFEGYCFQNTLLRFQARAPMNAEFCLLVFRHYLHAKRFKKESQITTNIAHLSSGRFVIIEFPVPPLEEQAEIVRRVSDALAASADALAILDAEAADAPRLKQSILKAAFEGRLVPQDPADEPASALLGRMAADPVAPRGRHGRAKSRRDVP